MNLAFFPTQGRLAGIDYGTVRIGVAVTDESRLVASPFENYQRRSIQADAVYFRNLAENEQIVGFVVGLPIHNSGRESEKSEEARRFGHWLRDITDLPVTFHDERFSSVQAEQLLGDADLTKSKRRKRLDQVAASIILASFLESHGRPVASPDAIDD